MSTPLPVPSKAAIRALRGIALGTSCAIGAIVEDRRRRICTLRKAVANKEKLKSSKHYYHGSTGLAQAHLDGASLYPTPTGTVSWVEDEYRRNLNADHNLLTSPADIPEVSHRSGHDTFNPIPRHAPATESSTPTVPAAQPPISHGTAIPGTSGGFSIRKVRDNVRTPDWLRAKPSNIGNNGNDRSPFPAGPSKKRVETPVTEIEDILGQSHDSSRLTRAVSAFINYSRPDIYDRYFEVWPSLSTRIAKELQEKDRWEDAGRVLASTVELGPLDEAAYFAHDPISIMDHFIRLREAASSNTWSEYIKFAANIFLAEFKEYPVSHAGDIERIGRRLMTELLSAKLHILARMVYGRTLALTRQPSAFVQWAIVQLYEHRDYFNVAKAFLNTYSYMEMGRANFTQTLDCVINSVQQLKGQHAAEILHALARIEKSTKLRSRWIMKLLESYAERHRDFKEVTQFFEKVVELGLLERVGHPQAVFRTMVELAVKTGNEEAATKFFQMALEYDVTMEHDIQLHSFLALSRAMQQDWEAVYEIFAQMQRRNAEDQAMYDRAFVMVLKIFVREHSEAHQTGKVHDFVTQYQRELGVGFHPYMTTLIANQYGKVGDVDGFLGWLAESVRAGFKPQAGYCNSVLHNCASIWKLSFPEIQKIYYAFEALNPDFRDEATHRIVSRTYRGGDRAKSRANHPSQAPRCRLPAVTRIDRMAQTGRSTNQRNVYEAMHQQLTLGKPKTAARTYQRAMHFGMLFSEECFYLAVVAQLRQTNRGYGPALNLIEAAHGEGRDVTRAVTAFIRFQIDEFQGSAREAFPFMGGWIDHFEEKQITVAPAVLTHLAIASNRYCQFERAVTLCTLAYERSRATTLAFSRQNIVALSTAYAGCFDLAGLKTLFDQMLRSQYAHDLYVLRHVQSLRRWRMKLSDTRVGNQILELIEETEDMMKDKRTVTRQEGKYIAAETLNIMRNALADFQRDEASHSGIESGRHDLMTKSNMEITGAA
ncbi:hypothetical protein F5Y18DRAFT_383528 [Xylariaceae sp. FL1019]|nr:hypothetical protein F5Y18DRAFT_383528 [Xylariaceae sp. FL1019]